MRLLVSMSLRATELSFGHILDRHGLPNQQVKGADTFQRVCPKDVSFMISANSQLL